MWLESTSQRKWRSDSVEARIYAAAEANALANGSEDPDGEAMEAVFKVMHSLFRGSYAAAVDEIKKTYGVDTSTGALSGFWDRLCSPFFSERMRRASVAAKEIKRLADTEEVTGATLDMLAQDAFEMMVDPDRDPETVLKFIDRILKVDKQSTDKRKVAVMEEKAKQRDEAKEITESDLSQEEKNQRLRDILK